MKEIEKMYKLARVANIGYDAWDAKDIYPSFTAEKQIELIKWLCRTGHCLLRVVQYIDTENWYMQTLDNTYSSAETFEKALASLINNLWQDLTDEDKKQIKEILE